MTQPQLCCAVSSESSRSESWVDGTLFFHNRNSDGFLDEAIQKGVPLAAEHVRDVLGLEEENIRSIIATVEGLGGHARRVSTLGDWLHFRLPESLLQMTESAPIAESSEFLRRSSSHLGGPDDVLQGALRWIASALQVAELEHLVSHTIFVLKEGSGEPGLGRKDKMSGSKLTSGQKTGRMLLQDGDSNKIVNSPNYYQLDSGAFYQLFTVNKSQAVKNIGRWHSSPVMLLQCEGEKEPFLIGANTRDCLLGFDVILQPLMGVPGTSDDYPLTIRFEKFDDFRKTCAQVPDVCSQLQGQYPVKADTYVYGFPLYKYTLPNVLYSGTGYFTFNTSKGIGLDEIDLGTKIFNYYNASALTLRDRYGVDISIQGSPETVQASVFIVGYADSAVNKTAINEYLSLLDLEPHSQLRISDFGVPNNVSVCETGGSCGETMLDNQALQSFAPNATTYFSPTSSVAAEEVAQSLMDFLDDLLTSNPRSQVASLSWNANYVLAKITIETLESYLKKLASIGISLLVSSGDQGASSKGSSCTPPRDNGPLVGNEVFPGWPTASPWVTSVGATQFLAMGEKMETKEVACSSVTDGGPTSAGGFSGFWLNVTTPDWQRPFVAKYLKNNNFSTFSGFPTTKTPGYNPTGRGFPDLASYGAWFPILDSSGSLGLSSGTSLSAPMTAAMFTLANQQLKRDGYDLIGYANPMLYWIAENCPEAFTDITFGNNQPGSNGLPCLYGFPAAPGWDPVTGLGSINFDPFVECAKKYQDQRNDAKVASGALNPTSVNMVTASMVLVLCSIFHLSHLSVL